MKSKTKLLLRMRNGEKIAVTRVEHLTMAKKNGTKYVCLCFTAMQ